MSLSQAMPLPGLVHTAPARQTTSVEDARVTEAVLYTLPILLLAAVLALQTWGVIALTLAALPLVPAMFALFIYITLP